MSITGSLLVFSEEIEAWEANSIPPVETRTGIPSFDASFRTVQDEYPGWEIRLYHLPKNTETLVYELRQKEQSKKVYADPVTGKITGVNENANSSIQRQLLLLHYTLLSGTTGKVIVFVTGILFFITLITGLVVYRRSIIRTFTFQTRLNLKTTRSFYSSLHRIIGVWSVLFNLLIVITGLWLSGGIALTALKTPAAKTAVTQGPSPIKSIDDIVKKLAVDIPDFEIHLIRIRPNTNVVGVSGRLSGDPSYYGNFYNVVTFNGTTTEITSREFMKDKAVMERLKKMAGPLHFGSYGGIALKILYCLLGLTPGFLSVSGFILWRKRGRKLKQKKEPLFESADRN